MCCCGKPIINGQPGYRWQPNDAPGTYPVNAPDLLERDVLLHDEPGRCGGLDGHSHHFRVVLSAGLNLLVRHGGGDERVRISNTSTMKAALAAMDSDTRYWVLSAMYFAHSDGERLGRDRANIRWNKAALDKRIKVRKIRGTESFKVVIETERIIIGGPSA